MKKIGIMGFGTIGRFIYEHLKKEKDITVEFIYDPYIGTVDEIKDIHVKEFTEDLVKKVDLVVEVAVSAVAQKYGEMILKNTNFIIFSATALADKVFETTIKKTAEENNTAYYIPHGAVLGLDGISDGKILLKSVEIVTTKKPKGFSVDCTERTILYEGATRGACNAYSRNVNVHAGIALAGLGMDKTYSKIIADPNIPSNTHAIKIKGEGFDFCINVESMPLGKVTCVYTPRSAIGSILRVIKDDKGLILV